MCVSFAGEFELGLQARVAERMRIARELHDTLLQTFSALLLKFQTVGDLLPTRPAEAKQILAQAIGQAADSAPYGGTRKGTGFAVIRGRTQRPPACHRKAA